jgi:chaperone BCS1
LNALDGVAESDGRIVFMTTNYLDRLDPALVRPGRVDFKQYIGHATQYQAENMFLKFYPEANPATAQAFAAKLMASNIKASAAQIQGYLMLYKNQPVVAYENIEHFESNLKNTATSHLVK